MDFRSKMIAELEDWAKQITGDGLPADRLIERWSAFTGRFGELVTIKGRLWNGVSDGWIIQIHRKAKTAYAEWAKKDQETFPLFKENKCSVPKMNPKGCGYDNGEDLPF